jgi:hypothetical protein
VEARADVGLAKAAREAHGADDRDPSAHGEILHRGVVDGAGRIVDEDVHATRAHFGDGGNEIGFSTIVDDFVVADLFAPGRLLGELVMPTARHPHNLASCPAICPTEPAAAEMSTVSPGRAAVVS